MPDQLTRTQPGWWRLALAPLALVAVLAACGGGSDDSATGEGESASQSDQEQELLDWAECMRGEGVDVPEPEPDADGNLRLPGGVRVGPDGNVDPEEMEAAQEVCGTPPPPPGGGNSDANEARTEEIMLEYAQCMRDHGIDMPDPEVDGGRVVIGGGPGGGGGGGGGAMDTNDPEFQAAQEACQDILADMQGPGGAGGMGAGGGG